MEPHPEVVKMRADLPIAARTTVHVAEVLAGMSESQLYEQIAGYDTVLAQLPVDDDTMRPTVQALRDVLAVELVVREEERKKHDDTR